MKREPLRALEDLSTAIRLATPETPSTPIHPKVARALAQAHTQRAAILHSGAKLPTLTTAQREDALSHDLFMGGHYGNELAKTLVSLGRDPSLIQVLKADHHGLIERRAEPVRQDVWSDHSNQFD